MFALANKALVLKMGSFDVPNPHEA